MEDKLLRQRIHDRRLFQDLLSLNQYKGNINSLYALVGSVEGIVYQTEMLDDHFQKIFFNIFEELDSMLASSIEWGNGTLLPEFMEEVDRHVLTLKKIIIENKLDQYLSKEEEVEEYLYQENFDYSQI